MGGDVACIPDVLWRLDAGSAALGTRDRGVGAGSNESEGLMTTFYDKEKECFVCGTRHTYSFIGSTNSMGASDLDTRPPMMARMTLAWQVHRCPNCGYCALDVSQGH